VYFYLKICISSPIFSPRAAAPHPLSPQLRPIKSWPGHQAVLTAVSLGLSQSLQVNAAMAPPLAHDRFPYQQSTSSSDQATCWLSSVTLHTDAVSTTWSLLGSPRNGQAALQHPQKLLPLMNTFWGSLTVGVCAAHRKCWWCVRTAWGKVTESLFPEIEADEWVCLCIMYATSFDAETTCGISECISTSKIFVCTTL